MPIQIYEEPSPLIYDRSPVVHRFAIFDPELVNVPFERGDSYFAETSRNEYYGKNGRRLKKPRVTVTPGSRPGTIAWIDWHPWGGDWIYIDFIKVRADQRGGRFGSRVVEEFYRHVVPRGYHGVHWGKVLNPYAWQLKARMQTEHPEIHHAGHADF